MKGLKLFLLLPILATVYAQHAVTQDWRFRDPRFGNRYIARPIYRPPITISPPKTETTTEVKHETYYPTTYRPIIPTRRPLIFNRPRPSPIWSRPVLPITTTTKPVVTVVVLPGDHSDKLPSSPAPHVTYVYPENYKPTSPEPAYEPIVHESEPIYTKPEPKPENKPQPPASPEPLSQANPQPTLPAHEESLELENSTPEPLAPSQLPEEPSVVTSPKPVTFPTSSPPQPTNNAASTITQEIYDTSEQPLEARPVLQTEPEVKPQPHLQPEQPSTESEKEIETSPVPQLINESTEPQPESQTLPESQTELNSEPKPTLPVEEQYLHEKQPQYQPLAETEAEPVSSPKPSSVVPPEAPAKEEPVPYEASTPEIEALKVETEAPVAKEVSSEPESNPLKLKYIPGIGSSRNPITSSWPKPSWPHHSKPSTIPNHPNPWMPTSAKPIPLPSRSTTTFKPAPVESSTTLIPVYVPISTFKSPSESFEGGALMDYKCKEPSGYEVVPNECDAFVECKSNIARQLSCPDGLHFNPKAVWPEYPCAYPSQVQCAAHYAKQAAEPTSDCPRQFGYFPTSSGDCGKYLMCQMGRATVMSCPAGLAFNFKTSGCDWPANVPSCNPDVFKGFTCPAPDLDEYGKPSDAIYKYRFGKSCKKYIACQLGKPRLLKCDDGLSYDHHTQSCIDEDFVKDCS